MNADGSNLTQIVDQDATGVQPLTLDWGVLSTTPIPPPATTIPPPATTIPPPATTIPPPAMLPATGSGGGGATLTSVAVVLVGAGAVSVLVTCRRRPPV